MQWIQYSRSFMFNSTTLRVKYHIEHWIMLTNTVCRKVLHSPKVHGNCYHAYNYSYSQDMDV